MTTSPPSLQLWTSRRRAVKVARSQFRRVTCTWSIPLPRSSVVLHCTYFACGTGRRLSHSACWDSNNGHRVGNLELASGAMTTRPPYNTTFSW